MSRRARVLAAAVASCAAAALAGPLVGAPSASAQPATPRNATFINAADTAFATFNPFLAINQSEIDTFQEIYPYLTFQGQRFQPTPYLARSWRVSRDHLTWTFHLRTGLRWSDGRPMTAADVAWTYELMLHDDTAATANGALVTNFRSVTAPDPATVVIRTVKPQVNTPDLVMQIPIVPEHIWKSKVKKLGSFTNADTPVVGYGPYRLTGYDAPDTATLTASRSFFGGVPKYHKLIIQHFANTSGAVAALRNGTIDSSFQLTDTEWRSLRKVPGIKTYETLTNDWIGIELNAGARTRSGTRFGSGNPLLADPKVRRAIALGIDRDEIVRKVVGGAGVVTGSYLTPAFPEWYWTPSKSEAQNYDPAKANAMLDAAGYPRRSGGYRYSAKTGKELSFRLGIHSDSPADAPTANYLVGFMKAIGIKLNVQSQSYTQLNDNLAVGDWDILMDQWPENSDPTYLMSIQTCGVLPTDTHGNGGSTDAFFCNRRYDRLFAAQQHEFDHAKRVADIHEMQRILYGADQDIILYDTAYQWATRDGYTKKFIWGKPNAQGNYPLQNYELNWARAVPAAASISSANSVLVLIIILAALAALVASWWLVKRYRRTTAFDRE